MKLDLDDSLIKELYLAGSSTIEISKTLACNAETVRKRLKTMGVKLRAAKKKSLNLKGLKYGSLHVIEMVEIDGKTLCHCSCECGNKVHIKPGNLRFGNNTSCGCHISNTAKNSKSWKGCGEISGYMWAQIRWSSGLRKSVAKRAFTISIQEAWDIFKAQNYRCALSGLPIQFGKNASEHRAGITTSSLDRIDSTKGYIVGNVQWVHKEINKLKTDFDQNRFVYLCELVALHAADKELKAE